MRHRHHQGKENRVSIGRKYVLPVCLGLLGMFTCHIFILFGFGLGIQHPIYWATYPIIYPMLVVLLLRKNPQMWLTDAIFLNAFPLLYWYILLWSDGKFTLEAALEWKSSSGMLVIMIVTIGLTVAVGFIASQREKGRKVTSQDGGGA
jgi:hypothetical protein